MNGIFGAFAEFFFLFSGKTFLFIRKESTSGKTVEILSIIIDTFLR